MRNIDLPADGIIKLNNNTQMKVRLKEGENNKLKLEVLDKPSNINRFYGDLKGHFEITGGSLNITFLNCGNYNIQQCEIEFAHHIEYWVFGDSCNAQYIDLHSKRKEICFRIENLKQWLYNPKESGINDNLWSYLDSNGENVKLKQNADFIKIKVGNKSNSYEFTYQDNKFVLSIIDEFQTNFLKYPEISLYPSCYLRLSSEKEFPVQFLYRMILKIQKLFSLFFNQVANVTSIYESKQFDYFIKYDILTSVSKPDIFITNDKLASTAVIKIHVEKCESHHYKNIRTEATPTQDGSIIKRCSICNDSQLIQTIAKPTVYTITKNTYNGKVLKPSVTITDRNGKKLSPSSYEIIYKKTGKNVGTYQAQINFRGDYTGSKMISYQILPKNCNLRSVKAKKKSFTVRWKKLSTKMPTKRISGYQVQYSEKPNFSKSKFKKVSGYKKTSVTIKKLKSKKKYYVRIRTILKSGGKTYYSNWSGSKGVKVK